VSSKNLTRHEEYVLLSILNLRDNAYLVTIQKFLKEQSDISYSFGTLYVLLKRLERAEYIEHSLGEVTSKRGGKAIKFYKLTKEGLELLKEARKVNDAMWFNFRDLTI